MGRPLKTQRPHPLNVSLDEDVHVKLELELWSDLESKVPFGAKSLLINKLLRVHFKSMAGKRAHATAELNKQMAGLGAPTSQPDSPAL